jgi:hypothetical protein
VSARLIAAELLQPVAGWDTQVVQAGGDVNRFQLGHDVATVE